MTDIAHSTYDLNRYDPQPELYSSDRPEYQARERFGEATAEVVYPRFDWARCVWLDEAGDVVRFGIVE